MPPARSATSSISSKPSSGNRLYDCYEQLVERIRRMENLARPTPLSSGILTHEIGRIVEQLDDGAFVVGTTTDRVSARRALGCLITPCAGDLVALMRSVTGTSYVVAVLERAAASSIELSAPGNVELVAASGSVT